MNSPRSRARGLEITVLAVWLVSLTIAVPVLADVATWTTRLDFEGGTVASLDTATVPGSLQLSLDPTAWSKVGSSPVLDVGSPGSWDQTTLTSVSAVLDGGTFKMWYSGCSGITCRIGYATSTDGRAWTKYAGNPILAGTYGWDAIIQNPSVIKDGTGFQMWFSANDLNEIRIGHATSTDGISWVEQSTPVLTATPGTWDQAAVSTPVVIREGASYTMWYSGHSGDYAYRIGRAASPDGANWTEYAGNPIMSPAYAWEESRVHPMQVLTGPSGYELFYYAAFNYVQIGHAVSTDGIAWNRTPTSPILSPGPSPWDSASLGVHSVVQVGAERWMWYSGSDGMTRRIGLARSPSYFPTGTFTSTPFDSGDNRTSWVSMEWIASTPSGSDMILWVRAGNASVPDAQWSDWGPAFGSGRANLTLPKARHLQVQATFLSNGQQTARLDEIRVTYQPTPRGAPDLMLWILLGIVGGGAASVFGAIWAISRRRPAQANPATQEAIQSSGPAQEQLCPRCGARIPSGDAFCGTCGQRVQG